MDKIYPLGKKLFLEIVVNSKKSAVRKELKDKKCMYLAIMKRKMVKKSLLSCCFMIS
jgi:hypothetical protein